MTNSNKKLVNARGKTAASAGGEANGAHRESYDEGSDASIDASEQCSCSEDEEED